MQQSVNGVPCNVKVADSAGKSAGNTFSQTHRPTSSDGTIQSDIINPVVAFRFRKARRRLCSQRSFFPADDNFLHTDFRTYLCSSACLSTSQRLPNFFFPTQFTGFLPLPKQSVEIPQSRRLCSSGQIQEARDADPRPHLNAGNPSLRPVCSTTNLPSITHLLALFCHLVVWK